MSQEGQQAAKAPKVPRDHIIGVALAPVEKERLDAAAERTGATRAELMRRGLKRELDRLDAEAAIVAAAGGR